MALPVIITSAGLQPRTPADIRTELINDVSITNPGYTANLPGSLIADVSGTAVGAISLIDQARVDSVNSITPYGVNEALLTQLGNTYGLTLGSQTNARVYVVFTGNPGYIIPAGFIVSDGTNQYIVQDGGALDSSGVATLFCLASVYGTFSIPANSVTTVITSVPAPYTVTCTNPNAGTPATTQESYDSYRARLLQAGKAASQGMATFLKTLLSEVSGVQTRLISVRQVSGTWQVIVGGGDPYQVAYAIYLALFDINDLTGSTIDPARDLAVSITDYPDTYTVTFVNPPQQTVQITLNWSTSSQNIISNSAVAQLAVPALVAYVNSITVGQPLSLFDLQDTFRNSITSLIPPSLVSEMVFTVSINGTVTPPSGSSGYIYGDIESYFITDSTKIAPNRV